MSFWEKLQKRVCFPGTLETSDTSRLGAHQLFRNRVDSRQEVANIDVGRWKLYLFEGKHRAFSSGRTSKRLVRCGYQLTSSQSGIWSGHVEADRSTLVLAERGRFSSSSESEQILKGISVIICHFTLPQWILILVLDFSTQNNRKRNLAKRFRLLDFVINKLASHFPLRST